MTETYDTEKLEKLALDLTDEGLEVIRHYYGESEILRFIEVTDTGDQFENNCVMEDYYAREMNNGTEGAWRE